MKNEDKHACDRSYSKSTGDKLYDKQNDDKTYAGDFALVLT